MARAVLFTTLSLILRRGLSAAARPPPRSRAPRKGGGGSTSAGPRAKQSLGQNFLQDSEIARRIVEGMDDNSDGGHRVYELGPGQGALSGLLLARYPRMTAVELDERMVEHLHETLPALRVEQGDLLKLDLSEIATSEGGSIGIVSNTPYYLTSPLLFKLLASVEAVHTAVLTTQKEVADKILCKPSNKQCARSLHRRRCLAHLRCLLRDRVRWNL